MSPRPRTVTDEAIVAGLGRVIGRVGPSRLTLALVAKEVGLSASTLVQRFGSKRNLLVQLGRGAGDAADIVAGFRRAGRSPLATLVETLLCYAAMASDGATFANHLSAYLQLDLGDRTLRGYAAETARRNERLYRRLLEDAVTAGELVAGADTAGLARALPGMVTGSLVQWASVGSGSSRSWLRRDLETVLAPWRRQGRTTAA